MIWLLVFLIPTSLLLLTLYGSRKIERSWPAIGELIDTEYGRLHITREGSGRPIIMLHGASSNLRDWHASIAPELASQFEIICIDRPGLGHSTRVGDGWLSPLDQANSVRSVIQQLEIKQPVLIGHSWSAALVMSYLLHYPGEVSAAVLIAPATHSWYAPAAIYNRMTRWPVLGPLFSWTLAYPLGSLFLNGGISSAFYPGRAPSNYRSNVGIDLMLRPISWQANADDLCLLNDYLATQSPCYDWISHPILAFIGEQDTVVSNQVHSEALQRQLKNYRVISFADTGHAPHHSDTQRVATEIRDFLNRGL